MKRFQKITKGVLYALLCVVWAGCGESDREKYDRFMTELDCPVVLIGKTDKAVDEPAITVLDGSGRVRTMIDLMNYNTDDGLPNAIADSRQIGDTLKPCK